MGHPRYVNTRKKQKMTQMMNQNDLEFSEELTETTITEQIQQPSFRPNEMEKHKYSNS